MIRALPVLLVVAAAAAAEPQVLALCAHDELTALAPKLRAARTEALAILFDDERYPVPAKAHTGWRVGIDVQPGHRDMERTVEAAIILHNRAVQIVADGLGVKTRTVGTKRPTLAKAKIVRAVQYYGILVVDVGIARYLKRFPKKFDTKNQLLRALGALARGKWEEARAQGGTLKGARALVWETVRAAAVLNWNERKGAGHDSDERDGTRALNAYRASLGLAPLVLDKRLHYMARDFALEMARGRFFSHVHPHDPSRRTVGRRARRAGYKGAVGENVSSDGDGKRAVWRWRADAGHHRVMVQPFFRAVGLGARKRSVLNPGNVTERAIGALYGPGNPKDKR